MNSLLSLAFIGGGNMARGLIGGLVAKGHEPQRICVADPLPQALELLRNQYGVRIASDNADAAHGADVVILAVKPQQMHEVTTTLAPAISTSTLVVSIAAGVRTIDIQRWCGGRPVVRCMPNRPALHGCGMTALYAASDVAPDARTTAEDLLKTVGATLWVQDESHLDIATAISGSGPAYFFLLVEMLEQSGIDLGLPPPIARHLAVQTAYGSGCMAREAHESAATLRAQVTSKGGTTEAALEQLEARDIRGMFAAAVTAATRRASELATQFAKN